jgi:hypothetical protein
MCIWMASRRRSSRHLQRLSMGKHEIKVQAPLMPRTSMGRAQRRSDRLSSRRLVTRDGRTGQSSWDEEDIRSLVAYLRTLPPIDRELPSSSTAVVR